MFLILNKVLWFQALQGKYVQYFKFYTLFDYGLSSIIRIVRTILNLT